MLRPGRVPHGRSPPRGGRLKRDGEGEARARAVTGIRASLVLNVAALPLSFVTNMVFGRISPEALGAYGALQILVGTSFTFLVFGGANVFTRFVPALDEEDRWGFLRSYAAVVALVFGVVAAAVAMFPSSIRAALDAFGSPAPWLAFALLAASAGLGLACWFLYAVAESTWAVVSEKLVVVGFFLAGLFALGPAREGLERGDVAYVWRVALAIYAVAAATAAWRLTRSRAFAVRRRGFRLPEGFWPVVAYTHVDTVVSYVQVALAPSLVLFWVDLGSLGYLHAALRYVVLLTALPASVMVVLGPELRRLVATGRGDEAVRQTSTAIGACVLAMAPVVLGLVVFAEPAMGLFGAQFRERADLLRLVAPSALAAPVALCGAGAALAVGAFRSYLRASLLYVAIASILIVLTVPVWGVTGAAAATSLAALARQAAIGALLRREGFQVPSRLAVVWVCAAAGLGMMVGVRPGLPGACAIYFGLLAAFAVFGRVRREEFSRLVRLGLGRA